MQQATCRICGTTKPRAEFPRDRSSARGYATRCKVCDRARCHARYAKLRRRVLADAFASWLTDTEQRLALPQPNASEMCAECGVIPAAGNRWRYCGNECAALAKRRMDREYRRSLKQRVWLAGACRECGDTFISDSRVDAFCSTICARRNQRRRGKQTRNTRIRAAALREPVDLATVARRDAWKCHICDRIVTRKDWSLDHLVPLSQGGDHTYANVALAHHSCNTKRGTGGDVQLRLAA